MLNSADKILTWHPAGKRGVYIARKDYYIVCDFILSSLKTQALTLADLIELGDKRLAGKFGKAISWNILVVKLDLEARGLIVTVPNPVPFKSQVLKLRTHALRKYKATFQINGSHLLT